MKKIYLLLLVLPCLFLLSGCSATEMPAKEARAKIEKCQEFGFGHLIHHNFWGHRIVNVTCIQEK